MVGGGVEGVSRKRKGLDGKREKEGVPGLGRWQAWTSSRGAGSTLLGRCMSRRRRALSRSCLVRRVNRCEQVWMRMHIDEWIRGGGWWMVDGGWW